MKVTRGFTLVEMALVLFILGLVLGGLISSWSDYRQARRQVETREILQTVEQALVGYALLHRGALPAADTDGDGAADGTAGDGGVPWKTLGLAPALARDAWDQPLRYRVDAAFLTAPLPAPPDTTSGLMVEELRPGKPRRLLTEANPNAPVFLLRSAGANGVGSGSEPDAACSGNAAPGAVRFRVGLDAGCPNLDDLVRWYDRNRLLERLVWARVWP